MFTIPGPQCARQVTAWLAGNDGRGYIVHQDISDLISAAENYLKVSPNSVAASGDTGTIEGAGQTLSYTSPPSCADPAGYWQNVVSDDAGFVGGDISDGGNSADLPSDMQRILDDFASLNAELKQNAAGVQISVHK
ncbi:MAG: hypothetical protein ACRDNT_30100 [Streptosporangiaceae bacterium]